MFKKFWTVLRQPLPHNLLILSWTMIFIMVITLVVVGLSGGWVAIIGNSPIVNAVTIFGFPIGLIVAIALTIYQLWPPAMGEINTLLSSRTEEVSRKLVSNRPTKIQDTSSNPSFVPNYTHDIFVSYAELDKRWAIPFIHTLQEQLAKLLGGMDKFSLFMEEASSLHPTEVTPKIAKKIQNSATFLQISSPNCSGLIRCSKEHNKFLAHRGSESVFVVATSQVQLFKKHKNLPSHDFWVREENLGQSRTLDYGEEKYYERINILVDRLSEKMKNLNGVTPKPSKSVFLANVAERPDYLNEKREGLKTRLKQQGYRVLPEEGDNSLEEQHLREEIAKCDMFVQLLSSQSDSPLQLQQDKCAKQVYGEKAGKHILQWFHHSADVEKFSGDYKNLLGSETVRAVSFRQFENTVVEMLKIISSPHLTPQEKKEALRILVSVGHEEDKRLADRLIEILKKRPSVSPELSSSRLGKNTKKMKNCEAIMVICGNSETDWVRGQLEGFKKYGPTPQRKDCFRGAVCKATPSACPTDILKQVPVQFLRCADNALENDVSDFLSHVESCV